MGCISSENSRGRDKAGTKLRWNRAQPRCNSRVYRCPWRCPVRLLRHRLLCALCWLYKKCREQWNLLDMAWSHSPRKHHGNNVLHSQPCVHGMVQEQGLWLYDNHLNGVWPQVDIWAQYLWQHIPHRRWNICQLYLPPECKTADTHTVLRRQARILP